MAPRLPFYGFAIFWMGCAAGDAKLDSEFDADQTDTDDEDGGEDGGEDGEDEEDVPVDADGDGYVEEDDCDDEDAEIHPDAEELDDGIDNDCNDYVDDVSVCEDSLADYETIQDAIDDVPDGWIVLVCAGDYTENLVFNGKATTVHGIDGADLTTLSPEDTETSVVIFSQTDGSGLSSFTVTGGASENGAGILSQNSTISLTDNTITENSSWGYGGGLIALNSDVQASGNTFSENGADNYGGGAYLQNTSGDFSDNLFEGNEALEGGGVFSYEGDANFTGNEFVGNHANTVAEDAWGPGSGGGALWMYGNGTVSDNYVHDNTSDYHAGGMYFYYSGVEFTGNTIENNYGGEDGAGVYFSVSNATIEGNHFEGNEAYDDGAGLRLYYGTCEIIDNTFIGNSTGDDGGGAKFSHSEHELIGNYFEGNSAGDAGGGLELDNDSSQVEGNVFIGNTATRGAGLHNWRTETSFEILDNEFTGNIASDCGGAMSFDNSPYWIHIHHNTMMENEAMDGGAICVDMVYRDPDDVGGLEDFYQDSYLNIYNNILGNNIAGDDGGGLYVKAGMVYLTNVVMDDNYGGSSGTIATKGSPVVVQNSIFYDNDGGAVALVEDDIEGDSGSITWSYSAFYDNDGGYTGLDDPAAHDGNIFDDPMLSSTWELESDSPCIDAGDPSISDEDGSRSDMGAFGGPTGSW
jgi:hypothetical protein